MDNFDLKILDALQADGRLTNQDLAETVGLSASQCSRRRLALEKDGFIESYHAHLSAEKVGLELSAFVEVSLESHSPEISQRFFKLVDETEEIQEAYALTGTSDYLVKVVVANLKVLSEVLNTVILAHPSVSHIRSSVVLDQLKQTSQLSLKHIIR